MAQTKKRSRGGIKLNRLVYILLSFWATFFANSKNTVSKVAAWTLIFATEGSDSRSLINLGILSTYSEGICTWTSSASSIILS